MKASTKTAADFEKIIDGDNGNNFDDTIDFEEIIDSDIKLNGRKKFEGTFIDYLKLLQEKASKREFREIKLMTGLAASRIYNLIISEGVEEISTEDDSYYKKIFGRGKLIKVPVFFKKEFFGMEETIMRIMRFFHSAAMRGEESRQVLFLVGPVGAGKSSLIEKIKRGLERETVYTLKGCPMHEEPLHLLPRHLREKFENILNIVIEGDLCPICRHRLKEEFGGNYKEFPVTICDFSIRNRVGIGMVPPVDPNNQDTSVLTGSVDISKLDLYSENDPRAIVLNGAFNVGNRGLVEFIEVFKNEIEFLHTMITATQEKMIPAPGKHSMIYFDGVIIAHSNEAEWKKFKAEHTNEAILDRIVTIEVPYVSRSKEEVKIYEKIIKRSDFRPHIAPHTLETVATFAVLTRLIESKKCDPITKLKLYDGEDVIEQGKTKKIDVQELKEEAAKSEEGMCGISTRFGMKCLDDALSDSKKNCINPISVREAMINKINTLSLPEDIKNKYLGFLRDILHKEYLNILEKEISTAFVHAYKEQAETLFQNYIDNAEAFAQNHKLIDSKTKEEMEPDEKFMASIEEQLGLTGDAAKNFRGDVMKFLFTLTRRGETLNYKSYEPLKEAIEKKLMVAVRDLSRIITKAKTRDEEQTKKYEAMVETMIKESGYCEHCCEVILKYAANHLWRD